MLRKMQSQITDIVDSFSSSYKQTPLKVKIVDAFLVYQLLTAALQFGYMVVFGSFPFNSFLSGFLSCITCFVITLVVRLQASPDNAEHFKLITPERSFADFCLISLVLHIAVMNYIG